MSVAFGRTKSSGEAAGTVQVDDAGSSSEVDIHRGEALLNFARTYPSLMKTLIEMIQNGIDNEAKAIFVGIDLDNRQVVVSDNGVGTTKERFEQALVSIGKSVKDDAKLGRFGLGLVSPVDKCEAYAFSSVPKGEKAGLSWTFRQAEIKRSHRLMTIPCKPIPGLPKLGKNFVHHLTGAFQTEYRTHIKLTKVTRDKQISLVDLDALESEVRQSLGAAMLRFGVRVRVVLIKEGDKSVRDIDPVEFQGDPLEVLTYQDEDAGEVVFELYRAPWRGRGRQGKVSVMETSSNYGVPMSEVTRQARPGTFRDTVEPPLEVLNSGFFEGYIKCANIQLNPDRKSFNYNDALHGFYLVLAQWYEDHGRDLFEAEQEESDRERYQKLGAKSLDKLKELLKGSLWKHFGRPAADPTGSEESPGDEAGGTGQRPGSPEGDGPGIGGGGNKKPTKSKKPMNPTAGGDGDAGGKKRTTVSGNSQGLSFGYDELPGNTRLWEFDFQTGTLIFNIRHPLWVRLDETKGRHGPRNDKWIMHLQEWLALELLSLLVFHASHEALEANRELIDQRVAPYVEMFIVGKR